MMIQNSYLSLSLSLSLSVCLSALYSVDMVIRLDANRCCSNALVFKSIYAQNA